MMERDAADLWERVGRLFAEPDSALAEISIGGLTPAELPRVARHLQSHAAALDGAHTYEARSGQTEKVPVSVGDLAGAAAEVGDDRREPFHVLLCGVRIGGVPIPDLGVLVFEDELSLDYRPGEGWTPAAVRALFELLREVRALAPHAVIRADKHALPRWRVAFDEAVAQHCDGGAAR